MTRKWNIPLTYEPKIAPVISGTCTQTIRTGRKFVVGDLIRFYRWFGRPYHSNRETITEYMPISEVWDIDIRDVGIDFYNFDGYFEMFESWERVGWLAVLDGIDPPTGEALRDVLISKNGKIPNGGIEAQIIRWKP